MSETLQSRTRAYRHPSKSRRGSFYQFLANNRVLLGSRRLLFKVLPSIKMRSTAHDIVYLNWLVDKEKVKHLVPDSLTLDQFDGKVVFTVLSYQHEHFGPRLFGPLRKLLPDVLQSNWRFYVSHHQQQKCKQRSVFFINTVMDSLFYTLSSRLLSDALPSAYNPDFTHNHINRNIFETTIQTNDPAQPDVRFQAIKSNRKYLPDDFEQVFCSWRNALTYLCQQDVAYNDFGHPDKLCRSRIRLPIDIDQAVKLVVVENSFLSQTLAPIVGDTPAFAFLIPQVDFYTLGESLV